MNLFGRGIVKNSTKTNNHWRSIAALLAGLAVLPGLGGCSRTIGKVFSEKAVGRIIVGKTTKSSVTASLGRPYRRVVRSDGSEMWTYLHRRYEDNLALVKLVPVPVLGQVASKMNKIKIRQKALKVGFADGIVSSCKLTLFEGERGDGATPDHALGATPLGGGNIRELNCGQEQDLAGELSS